MQIIECVPNFSEGKSTKTLKAIKDSIEKTPGVKLLNYEADIDHNRSVFTFIGEPQSVIAAAFSATKTAAELIDVSTHHGIHPRIGATDVLPLIPIKNISIKECAKLATTLAQKIGEELKIPTYLYEQAATNPEFKNLANIRKKGFEKYKPNFGPRNPGTAGATVVGAREILIAYNINLNTSHIKIAKKIAKQIREKDGGLKCVKALGLKLKSQNIAQVSMNLTNYHATSPLTVYKEVERLAHKLGTDIKESELIGLIPQDALPKNAHITLKIKNLTTEKILDTHY